MKEFKVNHIYTMRSVCDHNCIWSYIVTKRTAKTITVVCGKEVQTLRINKDVSNMRNAESVFPMGRYSMAPILSAY